MISWTDIPLIIVTYTYSTYDAVIHIDSQYLSSFVRHTPLYVISADAIIQHYISQQKQIELGADWKYAEISISKQTRKDYLIIWKL